MVVKLRKIRGKWRKVHVTKHRGHERVRVVSEMKPGRRSRHSRSVDWHMKSQEPWEKAYRRAKRRRR